MLRLFHRRHRPAIRSLCRNDSPRMIGFALRCNQYVMDSTNEEVVEAARRSFSELDDTEREQLRITLPLEMYTLFSE